MAKRLKKLNFLLVVCILLFITTLFFVEDVSIDNILEPTDDNNSFVTDKDVEDYENAIKLNSLELCKQLNHESLKNSCIHKVAVESKDLDMCYIITNKQTKALCLSNMATELSLVNVCEQIEDNEYWYSVCYYNYALAHDEHEYCSYTINDDDCYYNIAINTLNWKLCNQLNKVDRQTNCNFVLARKALNIEPCYQMQTILNQEMCILRLAKNTEDVNICEHIEVYTEMYKDCTDSLA